jgi:hypothetical protein
MESRGSESSIWTVSEKVHEERRSCVIGPIICFWKSFPMTCFQINPRFQIDPLTIIPVSVRSRNKRHLETKRVELLSRSDKRHKGHERYDRNAEAKGVAAGNLASHRLLKADGLTLVPGQKPPNRLQLPYFSGSKKMLTYRARARYV